ncbi:hypothetical protein [Streptacidiphilus fuscans]|uniref:Secreted protein n=1 Tax=Streptacidiphilus fuscans TaxID=2789292 RepID=A0A931FGV8_9ACTN|nr:hypothetical protein [Streptacidiphilus fuscans]MBF9071660.1 hypothetical protein [Streptacidiphilus fuscans]MBF9072853.1 hypothetical protein [Streptacidiphilus fuscans]
MLIRRIIGALAAALAMTLLAAVGAWAAEPPSAFGIGSTSGIVDRADQADNEVWFAAQDPNSRAKLLLSYNTTPALGSPVPAIVVVGSVPPDDQALQGSNGWFEEPVPVPLGYSVSDNPPSIVSPEGSVVYDPARHAYHLQLNISLGAAADLWFSGPVGGLTDPTMWDGQTSFWNQSLGTGTVNGWIIFPGETAKTAVTNWGAEQETQSGSFELGAPPIVPAPHNGYYYAQSVNADGSATTFYVFPELDGSIRGILTRTTASGQVFECEPSGPGQATASDWYTDPGGVSYPLSLSAHCADIRTGQQLTGSWTTTPTQSNAYYVDVLLGGFAAVQSVASSPGAKAAWIQHVADDGHFGPNFS